METSVNPKVLLAAPTSFVKDYCFFEWYLNILNFTYPNLDILLVDNSKGKGYAKYLASYSRIEVMHVEPNGRVTQEFITESQNKIREYFLKNDYDYLFSLESDIFPQQPDIIERLMREDVPIITAPYMIGQGRESHLLISYFVKSWVAQNSVFGMVLPMSYSFFLMDGGVKDVAQCGIGCTLIKREIMEQFEFRIEKNSPAHSDSFLYSDLYLSGIPAYIHTGCPVEHRNQDWGLVMNTWR